jgi:hypothetical protein
MRVLSFGIVRETTSDVRKASVKPSAGNTCWVSPAGTFAAVVSEAVGGADTERRGGRLQHRPAAPRFPETPEHLSWRI